MKLSKFVLPAIAALSLALTIPYGLMQQKPPCVTMVPNMVLGQTGIMSVKLKPA